MGRPVIHDRVQRGVSRAGRRRGPTALSRALLHTFDLCISRQETLVDNTRQDTHRTVTASAPRGDLRAAAQRVGRWPLGGATAQQPGLTRTDGRSGLRAALRTREVEREPEPLRSPCGAVGPHCRRMPKLERRRTVNVQAAGGVRRASRLNRLPGAVGINLGSLTRLASSLQRLAVCP